MDKLAITGIFIAFIAIIGGYAYEGGAIGTLFHLSAFIIVIGGSFGAVMLQTPKQDFINGLRMLPQAWQGDKYHFTVYLHKIQYWAETARQRGFLALEQEIEQEPEPFVQKALMMLVDGAEHETLRDSLQMQVELESEHKLRAANIFEALGGYSPTIGILGAVLGLIQAMSHINDPSVLGQGIATAFIATIYGVGAANIIFIPIGEKLKAKIDQEILFREMMINGIVAAANGENPQLIARRLAAYQTPSV